MPNWVFNYVDVNKKETLDKYITKNEDDSGEDFDFNKVIPMPEELNIDSPVSSIDAMMYLTKYNSEKTTDKMRETYKCVVSPLFGTKEMFDVSRKNFEETLKDNEEVYTPSIMSEMYERGKMAVRNYEKYGASNWYDWRLMHWGVKWNASDTDRTDDLKIRFDTPWSIPEEIFIEMSKQNPDDEIEVYSEEETGWWVRAKYKDGKKTVIGEGDELEDGDED